MKSSVLILVALLFLLPSLALSQFTETVVDYQSTGFRYVIVKSNSTLIPGFMASTGVDTSTWTPGTMAVGTLNNTISPPCPLNDANHVKVTWPSSRDVLLRKQVVVTNAYDSIKVGVAIDNGVQVFWDGQDISQGGKFNAGCASADNFVFIVTGAGVKAGTHILAVHGIWANSKSYLDVKVTGVFVSYKITLTGDQNLSFSPVSPVRVKKGSDQTITMQLASNYHVATLSVDGTSFTNPPASYTFTNVTANHTIIATSLINNTVVGTTNDYGSGSLRDAILSANWVSGSDNITFTLPGGSVIKPQTTLPIITDGVIVNGTSVTPPVIIDGSQAPAGTNGITINANGVTIKGMTIANFNGSGILINGNTNTIGGTNSGDGNIIRNNGANGVTIPKGTAALPPVGNAILSNSIYLNGGIGIDLGGDGLITQNVYGTPSSPRLPPNPPVAPNNGVNFPILSYASIPGVATPYETPLAYSVVQGSLISWPNTQFKVQAFLTDGSSDANGEGKTFLGDVTVLTDLKGNGSFSIRSLIDLAAGQTVTATATELAMVGNTLTPTNTSEFAANLPVGIKTKYYDTGTNTDGGHFVVNLTYSGIPLHWRDGVASFRLSNTITDATLKDAMRRSFATWTGTAPPAHFTEYTDPPNATVSPAQDAAWGGDPDGFNNVVWIDGTKGDWTQLTPAPSNVIAITRLRYNAVNGEITDADIAINKEGFGFTVVSGPVVENAGSFVPDLNWPAGMKDMEATITHEAGHALGLADIYNPGYPQYVQYMLDGNQNVTMYGFIKDEETAKRTLEPADVAGIAWMYSQIVDSHLDLALIFDGSSTYTSTYAAYDASKNSAEELITKLRYKDRVTIYQFGIAPQSFPIGLPTADGTLSGVEDAISYLHSAAMVANGSTALTSALTDLNTKLGPSADGVKAAVLFSDNETSDPAGALTAAAALSSSKIRLYTFGFPGSTGQDLGSKLASATGGSYYLTDNTTISLALKQVWNDLTGLQLIASGSTTATASNWSGAANWSGASNWSGAANWSGASNWSGAIDPGTSNILPAANWSGSRFVLFAVPPGYAPPSGLTGGPLPDYIVTPLNVGQLYPGGKYIEGATYAYYYIPNPPPGIWNFHLEGANDPLTTPNGETIFFNLVADANIKMDVLLQNSTYNPGNSVKITARLTSGAGGGTPGDEHTVLNSTNWQPVTNATVSALFTRPGQSAPDQPPVLLTNKGDGTYSVTYTNTNIPGTYNFKILATVPNPTVPDAPFTRESQQSFYVISPPPTIAILGTDSVRMDGYATITKGDVIVNNKLSSPNPQLAIGTGVNIPSTSVVAANTIFVAAGASVAGQVYYSTLTGTITGTPHPGLNSFPLVSLPDFFYGVPATDASGDRDVPNSTSATLDPGKYRDITLEPHSKLTLTGGVYHVRNLWVKSDGHLLFSGASDVRILGALQGDNGSEIGPASGSTVKANNIIIYVGSTDQQSPFTTAVNINPKTVVGANIYALNGTILMNQQIAATGAFIGKKVIVGSYTTVTLASAFNGLASLFTSAYKVSALGTLQEQEVPTAFVLSANYPNPFNPSTTIRYGLPRQSHVKLVIYDLLGQEVARLADEDQSEGFHEMRWDGRNSNGASVGSGVYIYRIEAGDFVQSRKMILMK